MNTARQNIVVIGGGAAGIIAAIKAAEAGASVTLLEKNDKLGMKILISGGGKCNLTHAGPMEEVRTKFRPNEARFLKPAFYKYTNDDFLDLLHTRGMTTYTRPDGRVFPVEPAGARDVVGLLSRAVSDAGVRVCYGAAVTGLRIESGAAAGVEVGDTVFPASRVIVCTGGSSYPATGTTGDGWRWLAAAGHSLVPLRAALAPLYLDNAISEWSGVALRDTLLRARVGREGKEFMRWKGDLLFTHKGVSGPTALGVSREVAEQSSRAEQPMPTVEADLLPDVTDALLLERLRGEVRTHPRKTAAALVSPFLSARLVEPLLLAAGIDPGTRVSQMSKKSVNKLAATLKGWPLGSVRHVPLERGEVVAGGIALDEVDPRTMRSQIVDDLFLCGEVLDIAGPVGGYNLQAAWSTGAVAGGAAAQ